MRVFKMKNVILVCWYSVVRLLISLLFLLHWHGWSGNSVCVSIGGSKGSEWISFLQFNLQMSLSWFTNKTRVWDVMGPGDRRPETENFASIDRKAVVLPSPSTWCIVFITTGRRCVSVHKWIIFKDKTIKDNISN